MKLAEGLVRPFVTFHFQMMMIISVSFLLLQA